MLTNNFSLTGKYDEIKRITLRALFSDDELMEMLVLKGGSAMNLIYNLTSRSSIDLDFSIESKIQDQDFNKIKEKIKNTLESTFIEESYVVFDFCFYERPKIINPDNPEFWGGYRVEFKIIKRDLFERTGGNINRTRMNAEPIAPRQIKKFLIDISKYEFCGPKITHDFEGLTIYVYSPEMIVIEKLRAICQQIPDYMRFIRNRETGVSERARDFYDIYLITQRLKINLLEPQNLDLLDSIFAAKKVSPQLLLKIGETREFHRLGYASLKDTINSSENIESFDFYFNYVVDLSTEVIILLEKRLST